jgi:hypothetical protein
MSHQTKDTARLICGMSEQTAQRYITVRQELDILIDRIHNAGNYLSKLKTVQPAHIGKSLALTGRSITHAMALVHDYLENEFASLEKVRSAVNHRKR